MRTVLFVGLLLGLVLAPSQSAQAQSNEEAVEAAKQEAQEWLDLFDARELKATWEEASSYFKSQISAEQWVARIRQTREQQPVLDSLRSRSLVTARYTTSLPKAPDGEYVVVQYEGTYADESWAETVTLKKDPDGWRVAGYFMKPTGQ
jgi:FKBP-type peptidyl-prolyl cis-trans isomerase